MQTLGSVPGSRDEQRFGPCSQELRLHGDRQISGDKWHTQITAILLSDLKDMSRCDKKIHTGKGWGRG